MKKIILLFMMLLLTVFSINAADIEVSHQLPTEEIYPGESVVVNIMVKNTQSHDDFFKLKPDVLSYTLPYSTFKDVRALSSTSKIIRSNQEEIFTFELYMKDDIEPDRRYTLNFNIKSGTNDEIKVKYPVHVEVTSPKELVKITTDIPAEVMPGKEVVFSVTFRNQANMMVDPAELYIDSDLFSKQYSEKLYPTPYEVKKTLKFTPEPTTKPGQYELVMIVKKGYGIRGKLVKTFKVKPNPDVESQVKTEPGFLTRTITVTKHNTGNVDLDESYELPITWFQKIMTSFSREPQKITPGKVEWVFVLEPGITETLVIKTDYRALFFTIIGFFIATIIIIFYIRSGVAIKKAIFRIKDEKGAVTELKIMLHVLNRTSKPIRDVKVVDILPNILKLAKEFGTLKPNKVQQGEKSSRLIWKIAELEPGEERIVSYKAKPGLHIIGRIVLPAALLRYRSKEHKIIDLKSNKIIFFSAAAKKEEED